MPDDALDAHAAPLRLLDPPARRLARGRVLEDVDLDDTLVIVCSDHGENFGEGGLVGHAFSLDDRLTRVPFVVGGPRRAG